MPKSTKLSIVMIYNQMLENLYSIKNSVEDNSREDLSMKLKYVKNKFQDLEDITKEEIDMITEYLHHDITATADYINKTKTNFKAWLQKDIELTEDKLRHLFVNVIDQSRVELQQMENLLHEWHSGEVTSMGSLECKNCGEKITFSETKIIQNCPKCNSTVFQKDFDF